METITKALGSTLLERIGNTPLGAPGPADGPSAGHQLLGKAEWANPGGSVKDRAASAIVAAAEAKGLLAGKHLLDATSGNTGIAYAMLGAAKGFPVTLCMPVECFPGAEAHPRRVRRERRLDRPGRRVRWRDSQSARAGAGQGPVLLRRPVRQRSQLEGALSRYGERDLAADRRADYALSGRAWEPAARLWASRGG